MKSTVGLFVALKNETSGIRRRTNENLSPSPMSMGALSMYALRGVAGSVLPSSVPNS